MKVFWLWRIIHNARILFKKPPYTNGFLSAAHLADHFRRHRSKFSFIDEVEYQKAADAFCGGTIRKCTQVCIRRRDGARIMYNTVTNELGFLHVDGHIGSYFKPTKKGLKMFRKQCI